MKKKNRCSFCSPQCLQGFLDVPRNIPGNKRNNWELFLTQGRNMPKPLRWKGRTQGTRLATPSPVPFVSVRIIYMAGKRCTTKEKQERIEEVARLIVGGANAIELNTFIKNKWGLSGPQRSLYVGWAREYVVQISDIDRKEFISAKIGQLETIARKSIESGQHSNAVGALRLMSEIVGVLGK